MLAKLAGFALPVTSYALQAMVTEPVKPALDTVVLSPGTGAYVSQSDKGEMVLGGEPRPVPLVRPARQLRGHAEHPRRDARDLPELQPPAAAAPVGRNRGRRARLQPIIGPTPVPGLYINCGWGTGGFKAIPVGGWTLAHVLATGRSHELAEPFGLERFLSGRLIDEAAAAGIAH